MSKNTKCNSNFDTAEWAIRSENWIAETVKLQKKRRLRQRNPNSLILSGHGTSLRIEKGTLVIREGFTHHPQEAVKHRYFPGDLDLPRTIILLDGSGTLSFDVLNWLSEQETALARITWDGKCVLVTNGFGHAADQSKVDWQRSIRADPQERVAFACDLITRKLQNSITTLKRHIPQSRKRETAIARATEGMGELKLVPPDMQQVRSVEGQCAAAYFRAWAHLELQWQANSKYPVPDHWKVYRSRASVHETRPRNKRASDPINAMLNYGYAVKTTKMQIDAIGDGYHPMLGIMHKDKKGAPAYVLDLLEPERPKVDAAILAFVNDQTWSGADFIMRKDGVCRLSPQLARTVASLID